MKLFETNEYFPGVYHISAGGSVMMTLIVLEESRQGASKDALLFDAGYGLLDPRPFIQEILAKHRLGLENLKVLMSHVHHDHILGGSWFDSFFLHTDDAPLLDVYTGELYRSKVLGKLSGTGELPPAFDRQRFLSVSYNDRFRVDLPQCNQIEILHVPGHTPGTLLLYLPKYKLLLTGDNWNPTTWLFFPEALPVRRYAEHMRKLLALDFEHVLCSHSPMLMPGDRLRSYIRGLTEQTFAKAVKTETPYLEINTLLCHPEPETNFVFRGA
jgi:glyoxylase-like metal-dependent hydrolase (beta-lactamase superfamily II)